MFYAFDIAGTIGGTIVAGACESNNYRGRDCRAGGLAGRRYKCFDAIDVESSNKQARPPALQVP